LWGGREGAKEGSVTETNKEEIQNSVHVIS